MRGDGTRASADVRIDPRRFDELKVWGFTVIPDVLDPATAAAMRDFVVERAFDIGVEHGHRGTARHLANLVTLDPMFLPAIDHPAIPYIEAMMGEQLILGSLNARVVRPGEDAQTLHADVPLPMQRYGNDAPLMMNTVWALSDLNPRQRRHPAGSRQPPEPPVRTAAGLGPAARDATRPTRWLRGVLPWPDLARGRCEPLGRTAHSHVGALPPRPSAALPMRPPRRIPRRVASGHDG